MTILLDTHILLWTLAGDEKLPEKAVRLIDDYENAIYYRIASIWETEIKHSLGKLPISGKQLSEFCKIADFQLLPIKEEHIYAVSTLVKKDNALKHNDPFDRIMIAQAKTEGCKFITHDSLVAGYAEECIVYVG